jgi:hypothetical protein
MIHRTKQSANRRKTCYKWMHMVMFRTQHWLRIASTFVYMQTWPAYLTINHQIISDRYRSAISTYYIPSRLIISYILNNQYLSPMGNVILCNIKSANIYSSLRFWGFSVAPRCRWHRGYRASPKMILGCGCACLESTAKGKQASSDSKPGEGGVLLGRIRQC